MAGDSRNWFAWDSSVVCILKLYFCRFWHVFKQGTRFHNLQSSCGLEGGVLTYFTWNQIVSVLQTFKTQSLKLLYLLNFMHFRIVRNKCCPLRPVDWKSASGDSGPPQKGTWCLQRGLTDTLIQTAAQTCDHDKHNSVVFFFYRSNSDWITCKALWVAARPLGEEQLYISLVNLCGLSCSLLSGRARRTFKYQTEIQMTPLNIKL